MALYRCTEATTPITPSDSSPVTMSANTGYKPTTNGYAIESQPTSVTPSDSSPVSLSNGTIYKAGGNGYAIASEPTSITPSNSSPATITSGGIYQATASGKAVASVTAKTPSDTSPASVSSGSIIKPSAAGYLVKTVSDLGGTPDKTYQNNSAPSSGTVDITVTKKPRYIILGQWSRSGSTYYGMVGIIDVAKSKGYRMGLFSQGAISEDWANYTAYFPTISSTKVTFSYAGYAANTRVQIMIYY